MTQELGYTFPNSSITRTHQGDDATAAKFRGEADILVYQLKNLMAFQKLVRSQMSRRFTDGTIITAWSIVNPITGTAIDFVDIDVRNTISGGGAVTQSCTITFLNLPVEVPPMRYPGEVREGEVEGTDYIKLYYSLDVDHCGGCQDEVWNLCDSNVPDCDQFRFVMNSIPSVSGDPNNHCLNTLSTCHAQLISHGIDAGGRFLIFKVFTEWSFADPSAPTYSRSGLGYMLLKGRIEDSKGITVCEVQDTLKVDCCLKTAGDRTVKLYDESTYFPGPRPFIILEGSNYYESPETAVDLDQLFFYGAFESGAFWLLPEYHGSCLPFTWALTGPGTLTTSPSGESATYEPPLYWSSICQNQSVQIRAVDRCGAEDILVTDNCCQSPATLEIGYTSLAMGCGASQQLSAVGGCGPYIWSLSGGGELDVTEGQFVTFTAPNQNANCTNNATITLTDCCGGSAQIRIAANCNSSPGTALIYCAFVKEGPCTCTSCTDLHCFNAIFTAAYQSNEYNCDGDVINSCSAGPNFNVAGGSFEGTNCIESPDCQQPEMPKECDADVCELYINGQTSCNAEPICSDCNGVPCNSLVDKRSAALKAAGCCPINPFTGLPYD